MKKNLKENWGTILFFLFAASMLGTLAYICISSYFLFKDWGFLVAGTVPTLFAILFLFLAYSSITKKSTLRERIKKGKKLYVSSPGINRKFYTFQK